MVEQIAVNDKVVGSSPTCGAYKIKAPFEGAFYYYVNIIHSCQLDKLFAMVDKHYEI